MKNEIKKWEIRRGKENKKKDFKIMKRQWKRISICLFFFIIFSLFREIERENGTKSG